MLLYPDFVLFWEARLVYLLSQVDESLDVVHVSVVAKSHHTTYQGISHAYLDGISLFESSWLSCL